MNRRQAPSVSYPVGPCVFWGGLMLAVWLAGAAGLAWGVGQGGLPAWTGLLPVAAAWPLWWNWRRSPCGTLRWDGAQGWSWQSAALEHELPAPQVVWRGQALLLLRLAGAPAPLGWLWLERTRDPVRWSSVCRATHAV